jgi:hypothetical protein
MFGRRGCACVNRPQDRLDLVGRLDAQNFDDRLAGSTDLALEAVHGDLEASFVRVVKL